jgi:hypothetical protein
MPMYRDFLELTPRGEENAVSSLLLWRQLGLWSHVSIKRKLNEMAAAGLIERKRGKYSGRETSLYFRPRAGIDRAEMNRLRRFYEKGPYGQTSTRVAYATSRAALPEPSPDAEWTEDAAFNAGDAILANPLLKEVYKQAILKGCAFEKAKN